MLSPETRINVSLYDVARWLQEDNVMIHFRLNSCQAAVWILRVRMFLSETL